MAVLLTTGITRDSTGKFPADCVKKALANLDEALSLTTGKAADCFLTLYIVCLVRIAIGHPSVTCLPANAQTPNPQRCALFGFWQFRRRLTCCSSSKV